MELFVDRPEVLPIHMGVDLRGRQVRMTQHFLHRPEIGAAFEQVSREAVPQGVRRNPLLDARSLGSPANYSPRADTRERLAPGIQEYPALAAPPVELGPHLMEVH